MNPRLSLVVFLLLAAFQSICSIRVKSQGDLGASPAQIPQSEIDKYERGDKTPARWGRLELGSDRYDSRLCLTFFYYYPDAKQRVGTVKCTTEVSMFFFYQFTRGILGIMPLFHFAMAVDFSAPVQGTDAYYLTAMLSTDSAAQVARGEDWAGHLEGVSQTSYQPLIFGRKNVTNAPRYCVRAGNDEFLSRVMAIPLQPGQDPIEAGCSTFRLFDPNSDFLQGQISVYSPTNTTNLCAAYNGDLAMVNQPAFNDPSQISVQTCATAKSDPNWVRQQFWVHRIMGHIRWQRPTVPGYIGNVFDWYPRVQPVVSMWWSGPLRMDGICNGSIIPDCVDITNINHKWSISQKYYAPIVSEDPRGFSGRCWLVNGDYIDAHQRCSLFLFKPHTAFLINRRTVPFVPDPPQPVSRRVLIQVSVGGAVRCLSMIRARVPVFMRTARRSFQTVAIYKFKATSCQALTWANWFVMSHPADRDCKDARFCDVYLRWSADLQNAVLWPRGNESNAFLSTRAVKISDLPDTWRVPLQTLDTIQFSQSDGCWGLDSDLEVVMTSSPNCASFRAFSFPPPNDNVTVVQEYHARTNTYRASDEKYDRMYANNTMSLKEYIQFASVYYADLGDSGTRNFLGTKSHVTPDAITVLWGGQLSFPFVPYPAIDNSAFGLITVEFGIGRFGDPCGIDDTCKLVREGHSYLLFSIQEMNGCEVFVTAAGHVGLRCAINDQVSICQARFDQSSLLDYRFHTVSLLYSTLAEFPHRLYVDGQLVMTCAVKEDWSILLASPRLYIGNQPSQWRYINLGAMIRRVAVRVGPYLALRRKAQGLVDGGARRGVFNATKLKSFDTSWENCVTVLKNNNTHVESIECDLIVTRKGQPYVVSRDVFSLACARPTCQIFFPANVSLVGSSFKFIYRPNYPMSFDAKNVGDPGPFRDTALVTDGFGYGHISAIVHYAPEYSYPEDSVQADEISTSDEISSSVPASDEVSTSDEIPTSVPESDEIPTSVPVSDEISTSVPVSDEIPTSDETTNVMDSSTETSQIELQTQVTDNSRYRAVESCCGEVNKHQHEVDEAALLAGVVF